MRSILQQLSHLSLPVRSLGAVLLLAFFVLAGCDSDPQGTPIEDPNERVYTFESSLEGWEGAFADYDAEAGSEDRFELVFDRRPLPDEVNADGMGLFLAGRNLSDDLFMFVKRRLTGLMPNTEYTIHYRITIASNAPSPETCAGIGGSPGGSVFMKVGAAQVEPEPVVKEGMYRLNVDKSNQSSGSTNARVIGTIANDSHECSGTPYQLLTLDSQQANVPEGSIQPPLPLTQTTDADGNLWVFLGTESGFEGKTALYYDTITLTLER